MTLLQAFILGVMAAYTPGLILLAVLLCTHQERA